MLVYLREVVSNGFHDRLLVSAQLGGCFEGRDEVRQFLGPVEEELYAAETRFFGLELEAPFHIGTKFDRGVDGAGRDVLHGRIRVRDLSRHFVGCDS